MYNYCSCGARVFELSLAIKLVPVILYQMMNGPFIAQLFTSMHLALLLQLASKLTYIITLPMNAILTYTYMYAGTRLIGKHETCMVVVSWYYSTGADLLLIRVSWEFPHLV